MIALSRVISEVAVPSLAAKPVVRRNGLQESRLAGSVLASKETDARAKNCFVQFTNRGNREGIGILVRNSIA